MISNSIKPLDLVQISGISETPVICIVSPSGDQIILSTKTHLSNALVDDRILHANLGSLINLVGVDTQLYSEIVQYVCDISNSSSATASKDVLRLARAFNHIKENNDIKSLLYDASLKDVIKDALLYADELQEHVEKAHFAIVKLSLPSSN